MNTIARTGLALSLLVPAAAFAAAPVISSFSASVPVINPGRSVTLNWSQTGATSLTLNPGSISVTGLSSYSVSPATTTTYTLTATNASGSVQQSTTEGVWNWASLNAALDNRASLDGIFGYGIVLFDHTGELERHFYGNVTATTYISLDSATKLPAAAAMLTLVDQGKLSLGQTVTYYLKKYAAGNSTVNQVYQSWNADPAKAPITIGQLLSHTSGLISLDPATTSSYPSCASPSSTSPYNSPKAITMANCVIAIAQTPLMANAVPGGQFAYSGADYQVAGYIATLVTGLSWQAVFVNNLVTPLNATPYNYDMTEKGTCNYSAWPYQYLTNPHVAGGATAGIDAYEKILQMIFNGGSYAGRQVLQPQTAALLTTNQAPLRTNGSQTGLPVFWSPTPDPNANDIQGYSFGTFVPTNLSFTEEAGNYPPYSGTAAVDNPAAPLPANPAALFFDPGFTGAISWMDNNLGIGAVIWNCDARSIVDATSNSGADLFRQTVAILNQCASAPFGSTGATPAGSCT